MKPYYLPISSKLVKKLLVMSSEGFDNVVRTIEEKLTAGVLVDIRGPVNTHHTFPCLAINFSQTASGSCFIRVASESDSFIQNPKRYFLIFQPRKRGIPHGTWCLSRVPFSRVIVANVDGSKFTPFLHRS
jgi:hypothetical protein